MLLISGAMLAVPGGLLAAQPGWTQPPRLQNGLIRIPPNFFGLHWLNNPDGPLGLNNNTFGFPKNVPLVDLGQRTARLWDTFTSWRFLEPNKGEFDFSRLDEYLRRYRRLGIDVVLTLGQTPDWAGAPSGNKYGLNPNPPSDLRDWSAYVQAVVAHCRAAFPGVVVGYEIWNEPDLPMFWTGTVDQMVALTKSAAPLIRAADPSAKVLCAPMSRLGPGDPRKFLDQYLRSLDNDDFDVFAIHGYNSPEQPEIILDRLKDIREILATLSIKSKPLWVTEFSQIIWFEHGKERKKTPDVMDEQRASSYIARMFIMFALAGAARAIFYGLNYTGTGIWVLDPKNPSTVLAPGRAFHFLATTLGAVGNFSVIPTRAGPLATHLYSVDFMSKDGRSGVCFWCADEQSTMVDLSQFSSATDVSGTTIAVSASTPVNMSPIFAFR